MSETLFESQYKRLNPSQKKAVDTIEGPVMVIAGPGTGKTQTLILRIANILLKTQVNPENILVLTFTESAVHEMRKRLVELIGTAGYRVEINTFHGFCNDLIQYHTEHFEHLANSVSIEEVEQIGIIEKIISSQAFEHIKPFGAPEFYIRPILKAIDELKKEGITPQALRTGLEVQKKEIKGTDMKDGMRETKLKYIARSVELADVYEAYQKILQGEKKYDFNDMILEVIDALGRASLLRMQLQEQYQYILVDEHQDTNAAQNKVVELMGGGEKPNIFVVGDEKQAIFRFQGASLENFLYFKNRYKAATLINLEDNYRSTQSILNAAGALIKNNPKSQAFPFPPDLRAIKSKKKERLIDVAALSTYMGEQYFIAQNIEELLQKKKVPPQEIAILVRNNKDAFPFISLFQKVKIPFVVESDADVSENIFIQKLLSLFNSMLDIGNDNKLIEVMHIDTFHINPVDIYRLATFVLQKQITLWEIIEKLDDYQDELHLESPQSIIVFSQKLKKWKTLSMNDSIDNVFIDVLNTSGILASILETAQSFEIINKVALLYNEVKKEVSKHHLYRLTHFMQHLELLKKHNIKLESRAKGGVVPAVRLMTVHRSKGLEFDYVYLPHAYDGHWGNKRKRSGLFSLPWEHLSVKYDTLLEETANEDERRLFYVGVTRARKHVTISYARENEEGKAQIPSQFIKELGASSQSQIDGSLYDLELSKNPAVLLQQNDVHIRDIKLVFFAHKEFFQDLFSARGLSVSGLNNYLSCPWKYFFRNLLRIPDSKNKNLIFGTSIHFALNQYIAQAKKMTLPEVINSFMQSLSTSQVNEVELNELQNKGKQVLTGYYNRMKQWKGTLQPEVIIKGIRFANDVYLNGRIDMIESLDNKGTIRVYDFKTGKPKSRNTIEGNTKGATGDYKRQLVFYKLLLEKYKEGRNRWKVNEGIIEFVEPDQTGVYKSERFTILNNEVEELKKIITTVAGEIRSLSFWDKTCKDKECAYCKMRSYIG